MKKQRMTIEAEAGIFNERATMSPRRTETALTAEETMTAIRKLEAAWWPAAAGHEELETRDRPFFTCRPVT